MWKDLFYFSQREKRGIIVLCSLIIGVVIINISLPFWLKSNSTSISPHDFLIASVDSIHPSKSVFHSKKESYLPLTPFRVDTVSSIWLINHGMPKHVANNFISYRDQSQGFLSVEKVNKTYGFTDSLHEVWVPFMRFPIEQKPLQQLKQSNIKAIGYSPKKEKKVEFTLDLNEADTAILQLVKGIGPSFASRIVKYRNILGGYYSVEQLREVYGMDSAKYQEIKPFFEVKKPIDRLIHINSTSVRSLKNHPYLNFYQAKAIYEFRKSGAVIDSWDSFLEIDNLDTVSISRIKPYLSYEPRN